MHIHALTVEYTKKGYVLAERRWRMDAAMVAELPA